MTPMSSARRFPTVVTLHELVELADLRALHAPGGIFAPLGARILTTLAAQADLVCLTMRHYADWLSSRGVECRHIPIGAYHEPEMLGESESNEMLFFTTLAPYKGLELLIPAFLRLRCAFPDLRLTIAGASHTRFPGYARQLQSQFRGAHGIRWLGQVPEEHVKDLFQRARLIVLPYSASTGSSSVLYQAATWGRAIVASNLDETKRMTLENDLCVEFFERDNPVSLYHALNRLLQSSTLRQAQAQHNFGAVQYLRPQKTCYRYIQAFNRILEKRQSTKRIPLLESA
jgi:glycosyltransferase involved in cell wall biosynthesis